MENKIKRVLVQLVDSSSSGESDSDLEEIEQMITNIRKRRQQRAEEEAEQTSRRKITKNDNYFETIQLFELDVFKSHFRLSKTAVSHLEGLLQPIFANIIKNQKCGRDNITLINRILLCLWTLANIESFRGIADRFGVGKGTAHNIFIETCEMVASLEKNIIKWPTNYEEVASKFKTLRSTSFPGIIGAVDGVDISIIAPSEDKISYYNRKGTYSIKMQGICDSPCKFTNVFIGYPGSCHDASMWKASPIYEKLKAENNKEYHLVGDSAYPLDVFLMKPFRDNGHLTREQKKFNQVLSSHRVVIENAYGLLKGKFRRLKYLHMFKMNKLPKVVMACCILHNIALDENEISQQNDEDNENNSEDQVEESNDNASNSDAQIKRNYICTLINN